MNVARLASKGNMSWKKRAVALLASAGILSGLGVVAAAPSQAFTATGVAVTVTSGWCPASLGGGTPRRVNISILQPGTAGSTGGDTVYNLQATTGIPNEIDGTVFCQTAWWGKGYYRNIQVWRYFWSNNGHMYI
jgi:hypothetical protein